MARIEAGLARPGAKAIKEDRICAKGFHLPGQIDQMLPPQSRSSAAIHQTAIWIGLFPSALIRPAKEIKLIIPMNIQMYLGNPTALKEACRLYKKYDLYDKGYMTIADEAVVEAVHAIDKDIAICLTPGWNERADEASQRRCAELGCRFFQPVRATVTPEKLLLAKELGLRANVFYADSEIEFAGLYNMGAPGIMTNVPRRLVEWLKLQK